jgi:glycosyltransferase involved in cell wall biosynthesis
VIYINDCSKDGTGDVVEAYLQNRDIPYSVMGFERDLSLSIEENSRKFSEQVNQNKTFFTLINNQSRIGACGNLYYAIQSCEDFEIVVTVDGDDWLNFDSVFQFLNICYASGNVWLTHGNLMEYPSTNVTWCEPIPPSVVRRNAFREFKCPTHLRTFYAWLYKKIKLDDLTYNSDFFAMTWDMAMMYPMIEMAAERHVFIEYPVYVYNMINPINDNKVDAQLQRDMDVYIRSKKPYQRLSTAEIPFFMNQWRR